MPDPKTSTSLYLLPGMKAKLKAPGYYIATGNRKLMNADGVYEPKSLTNGFVVQYDDVGTIEAVPSEPAVVYTHKKFGLNKIYFFARTGEIGIVDVVAVPIHDHSSIVTGGPAYGTYFTDDETIGE